jgi:hypothetical protein
MDVDVVIMVEKKEGRIPKLNRPNSVRPRPDVCSVYCVTSPDRKLELVVASDLNSTAAIPTANTPPHCSNLCLAGCFGCSLCSTLRSTMRPPGGRETGYKLLWRLWFCEEFKLRRILSRKRHVRRPQHWASNTNCYSTFLRYINCYLITDLVLLTHPMESHRRRPSQFVN